MIERDHEGLSIARQCELVSLSRASFYRQPEDESEENLELMREIDEAYLETPFYGARQMVRHLRRLGWCVGRKRVRRLMRKMGLAAIYQEPRTSAPHPEHKIYPYLLRDLMIERPNQVWCADITYIQMRRGFLYLVAIMDWASRKVLAWRLSNTMDVDFCLEALEEAIAGFGRPEIFNTDQGCSVHERGLYFEAQGRGRAHLHGRTRPVDGQCLHRALVALAQIRMRLSQRLRERQRGESGIGRWIDYYNASRPHSSFGGRTPDEVHAIDIEQEKLAA